PMADATVKPKERDEEESDLRTVLQKLFDDIGPRFANRPGGYTRILKRHQRRLGDAGSTAFLELLKEGEVRSRARAPRAAPAPAPQVEQTPAPELPPPEPPTSASERPLAEPPANA